MLFFSQFIGVIGVVITISAYFMLQTNRINADQPLYSWMNVAGSLMIIFSMFWEWNLPSFLMEGTWAAISLGKVVHLWRIKARRV